jgi:hypothetical protein
MIMLANLTGSQALQPLKNLLLVSVLYLIASSIVIVWVSFLITILAVVLTYNTTVQYQDLWPKLGYLETQALIIMPMVTFSVVWLFLLLQFRGVAVGVEVVLTYFICMGTALWPLFLQSRKEAAPSRKFNYKYTYLIASVVSMLFFIGVHL